MIRVEAQGVMTYRLVEDKEVVRTETRTIAEGLSREDADRIAELLRIANGKVEQAEINKKLDEIALADLARRDATLRRAGFIPSGLQTPAPGKIGLFPYATAPAVAADGWAPSTRYPGTFENAAGFPCLCFHCKAGRKVADAAPQYSIRPMIGSNVLWQLLREDLIIAGDMTRKNAQIILKRMQDGAK